MSGWTGGHYSTFRIVFALYLFVHFVTLLPWGVEIFSREGALPNASASPLVRLFPNVLAWWDAQLFVTVVLIVAAGLAALLGLGLADRVAAPALWYIWACLLGRNPLISNPGLPYIGWMLLAIAFIPAAPYGSLARRGWSDPGTGWQTPADLHRVAWILMALGYAYSGYTKLVSPSWVDGSALHWVLESPLARPNALRAALLALPDGVLRLTTWCVLGLELAFAPLALARRLRPWLWGGMLLVHLGIMATVDFVDLSLGMVMLHLFTFDPAWVPPRSSVAGETIFYDGQCGLCHRLVRFVLSEDRVPAFRFAALQGETFRATLLESQRAGLPDSIVILCGDGALLSKSEAILYVLERLGGCWRALAVLASPLPKRWRDVLYDRIASMRYRLFARPAESCPLLPSDLRTRFVP